MPALREPNVPHVPSSDPARLRAIKRHLWRSDPRFLATCALGVEGMLAEEVAGLEDASEVVSRPGGASFRAPFDTLYQALLNLRLAESLRVVLASEVAAATFPMLFDQLTRVRWSLWLPRVCALTVRVSTHRSRLRDREGLEEALIGALRRHGVEPREADAPAMTVHLRLDADRATAQLDLGGPLYRRSGDKWVSRTTIRETTAAALVRLAEVAAADLVLDPFCGSGTLLSEALEASLGLAPGRRRTPPFAASPAWKAERERHAMRRQEAARNPERSVPHLGSDADARAVAIAERNLSAAGLDDHAHLSVAKSQELDLGRVAQQHGAGSPLLLSNPPYGRAASAVGSTPHRLLRDLLSGAPGWRFALLYPDIDAITDEPWLEIERRLPVVTSGLRNALVVGSVRR